MALVKAKREELLDALSAVTGIIERRQALPILSNVLLDGGSGSLGFLATDIEIQITSKSSLPASGEVRTITVGARKLLDILRALPGGAEVALVYRDRRLEVKSGRSRFLLQTLPAEDFPKLAAAAGEAAKFSMPQADLRRLIGLVQYAMAQQDIRYYLNGLLLVIGEGELHLVATDGHRLALASSPLDAGLPRQEVILPRKTVLELARLLGDGDAPVAITIGASQASFGFGEIELVSKLIDGKFPDYNRVVPSQHLNLMRVDRERLREALQRAAILSNDKFRGVRCLLGDGQLRIVSSNAEQEEAEETLEVDYNGDGLDIGFNVTYLLDVLNNVAAQSVEVRFGDASSSALFGFPEVQGFKYVVMPMRI